jgi:hypothetical protein
MAQRQRRLVRSRSRSSGSFLWLLATNLRHFLDNLNATVPWKVDQEHCRQLLANVEFVMAHVAPSGSPFHSWVFRCVTRFIIAGFPVFVLLLLEISALRYESDFVNWMQRGALVIDLSMLVWFYRRRRPAPAGYPQSGPAVLRLWIPLLWLPAAVGVVNLAWLNIPGPEETTVRVDEGSTHAFAEKAKSIVEAMDLHSAWKALQSMQPLDRVLCPTPLETFQGRSRPVDGRITAGNTSFGLGCRFLNVDHRTPVDQVSKRRRWHHRRTRRCWALGPAWPKAAICEP